jgi:hypothetical protein
VADESLVKVYESQGMFAAEVAKAKLEANGIPAMLKYESVGQVIGITIDGLGRVEVYVPADLAEDALELLDEATEAELEEEEQTLDEAAD